MRHRAPRQGAVLRWAPAARGRNRGRRGSHGDGPEPADPLPGRFGVLCFVALLPAPVRIAALDELVEDDPALFRLGFDPPTLLSDDTVAAGAPRVRTALAATVRGHRAQRAPAASADPAFDAGLYGNRGLCYDADRVLRLRDPAGPLPARVPPPRAAFRTATDPGPWAGPGRVPRRRNGPGRERHRAP